MNKKLLAALIGCGVLTLTGCDLPQTYGAVKRPDGYSKQAHWITINEDVIISRNSSKQILEKYRLAPDTTCTIKTMTRPPQ